MLKSKRKRVELTESQRERAGKLHRESIIVDSLGGHIVSPEPPPVGGKPYLQRLAESGVTALNITLVAHADDMERAFWEMYAYYNLLTAQPEKTRLVENVSDIHAAKAEGKIGIVFGFQGAMPIGPRIERWTIFHKLGLRVCALTYQERNVFGDGCMEPENRGLTAYGHQAVSEMNRLGIAVDLSHVGERTSLDAIAASRSPVVFSHSNVRALCPSRRNLTDEQIKACAATGGAIGITPHSELSYKTHGVRPTMDDYLNHIEYVADLVGTDHVGIGSDMFESYTKVTWEAQTKRMYRLPWFFETMYSDGFSKMSDLPRVTEGLVARGFSDGEVQAILGQNWLRVFGQIWGQKATVA